MANKKMSADQRRERKKLYERKRRERIKNNKELYKIEQEKKHMRYEARKKSGRIKLIHNLSPREARIRRKMWKEYTKRHREKLKNVVNENHLDLLNEQDLPGNLTPSCSQKSSFTYSSTPSRQKVQGKRVAAKKQAFCYRKIKKLNQEISQLKSSLERYKKKYYREKCRKKSVECELHLLSPNSKVNQMIESYNIPKHVKKKLLFGEVINRELSMNFKNLQDNKSKQAFVKVIKGRLLKKYRLLKEASGFLPSRLFKASQKYKSTVTTFERRKMLKYVKVGQLIRQFYIDDENSRLSPNKQSTITRNGIKKQKRYLNNNLKVLYENFQRQYKCLISYQSFCRLRPFWVVMQKISERDTCACLLHENTDLLISVLNRNKIIPQTNSASIINALCCEARRESCLTRSCEACIHKKLLFDIKDNMWDKTLRCKQWVTKEENRISLVAKKPITVRRRVLEEQQMKTTEIINNLNHILPKFLSHTLNITHQYSSIKHLKNNLRNIENAILFHIDFSENYACKYATEVQSVHFGASREQVSLHTGVVYYLNEKQGFCSFSKNVRHDAPAVMAHMMPIIKHYLSLFGSTIDTVHFVSDSTSTQYRNKNIFYYMKSVLPRLLPNIKKISWNYSESGHGKGAPDGIGATVKRCADRQVIFNKDVDCFEKFFKIIQQNASSLFLEQISNESIEYFEKQLPQNVPSIKGVMQAHQATWEKESDTIRINSLSCFNCEFRTPCIHYYIEEKVKQVKGKKNLKTTKKNIIRQQKKTVNKEKMNDVKSSTKESKREERFTKENKYREDKQIETNEEQNEKSSCNQKESSSDEIKEGDWIVVLYETWYPGIVDEKKENLLTVNFMIRNGNSFQWPTKSDKQRIEAGDILCKLKKPPLPVSSRLFKIEEMEVLDQQVLSCLK